MRAFPGRAEPSAESVHLPGTRAGPALAPALPLQFASIAGLCVSFEADYRPRMSTVVETLSRLVREDEERNGR